MEHYKLDQEDKINSINRCFFDAEHGWITLSLDRLTDLLKKFPEDAQVEYAEALIKKDFIGQGLKAQELFLKAQLHSRDKQKSNQNYLFSTFNAAKYARNEEEFRKQCKIALSLAPKDSDSSFFEQITTMLDDGVPYIDILSNTVADYQKHSKYGDCASFAELALNLGNLSLEDEIALRKARMMSLRELDKAAEASRGARGEGFSPKERIALKDAIKELEIVISLDPYDHLLWNFKSAWFYLMDQCEDAIAAADKALSLCPIGYIKPRTNKSLCLQRIGRNDEAKQEAELAFKEANRIGIEGKGDKELANSIIESLSVKPPTDDYVLSFLAKRMNDSVQLTSRQEMAQWKGSSDGKELLKGLIRRTSIIGKSWSMNYVRIMEELLIYFCPETVYISILKLSDSNEIAYEHCLHSVLYIAAFNENVLQRDACRFIIYMILGSIELDSIKKVYRKAILGSTIAGPDKFANLEKNIRKEIASFNLTLLKLIADQSPLTNQEIDFAKRITMARFIDGVSRDPHTIQKSFLRKFIDTYFKKSKNIGTHCYKCRIPMTMATGMLMKTTDYLTSTKGCFQCNACGRLTCFDCCDNRIPCECGAKTWIEKTYIIHRH
jgi:hypothetical protein